VKYAWIQEHRDSFPIAVMCDVLQVSASGYYDSLTREPSPRQQRHARIQKAVQQAHAASHGNYGSYKIAEVLEKREDMETACRNTVSKTMREMGLKSRVCKAWRPTTTQSDPSKQPAPNVLAQDFTAEAPNRKWVTDITYVHTLAGWAYVAVVLDLFSRKVVGWAVRDTLATELVQAALRNAIEKRQPQGQRLLHHSDRGCQYTSDAYQHTLNSLGIECSMSRTGCCYDNAVMERFFWSLKHEWTNHETYANLEEVRFGVFQYIETFYNTVRIHQTLGYLSPDDYESEHAPALAA
jgi:putative transposase